MDIGIKNFEIDFDFIRDHVKKPVTPYQIKNVESNEVDYPLVYKISTQKEFENYQFFSKNDSEGLMKFCPKYYYGELFNGNEYFAGNTKILKPYHSTSSVLILENLTNGLKNYSWIDIKLGCMKGAQKRYLEDPGTYMQKAIERNTFEKCYWIIEYEIKDQNTEETIARGYRNYSMNEHDMLKMFFTNKDDVLDKVGIKAIWDKLIEMKNYFLTTQFEFEYRDTSLFIVADHNKKVFKVTLLDLDHIDTLILDDELFPLTYKDDVGILRDGSMIKALENVHNLFMSLITRD